MKKAMALVLVLIMVFAFAGSSLAERKWFDIVTESTTEFKTGCYDITKTTNLWQVSLSTSSSNLSPTHRAVARVHKGTDVASATWVYSGPSAESHGYGVNYQGYKSGLSFRGRLDNRDSGLLEFHGYFVYNY